MHDSGHNFDQNEPNEREPTESDRLQQVFSQVVALPKNKREDWLTRECKNDIQLLQRVQTLLDHDSPNEDPLEDGLTNALLSNQGILHDIATSRAETDDFSGQVLCNRFELQEQVGSGGFAQVYRAIDLELDRVVAIKIPLSARLTERFLREAQSAARLRHANIVTVHEVGRDKELIYIVSDFINGITLAESMSQRDRYSRESVELIAKVAGAVQHAHDNGIVHRDIKPSNVMLDERGEPHLTDFGLAKQESADVTMTIDGQVIGTPAYMSPEQARGEGHQVDGRADVYALGAVLFELLTGERPFRGSTRMILHQVVTDDAPSPRRLNANVPMDLETICLKCLEKQPEQRYPTAADLIVDLEDFLAGRPIKSRPLGYSGRLFRWAKRKPIVAVLSFSLLMAMVIGTLTSTYFAISAQREANKLAASLRKEQRLVDEKNGLLGEKQSLIEDLRNSNEEAKSQARDKATVLQFFQEHVLATTRPKGQSGGLGIDVTIRDAVDEAELRIADTFRDQPLVEAALRRTLADTYFSLGQYDKSIAQYNSAIHLFAKHKSENDADKMDATIGLILAEAATGNEVASLELAEKTLHTLKKEYGIEHLLTLRATNVTGKAYEQVGRHHKARALLERVYNDLLSKFGENHPATISAMNNLAHAYRRTGHIHEAVQFHQKALSLAERRHGVGHVSTLSFIHNLAVTYSTAGRKKESIDLYLRAITLKKQLFGKDHPSTINSMINLSSMFVKEKRTSEAIPILEEAQTSVQQNVGADHPLSFSVTRTLAWAFHYDGHSKESVRIMEPMIVRAERKFGREHPDTCQFYFDLAEFYDAIGRREDAHRLRNPTLKNAIRLERSNPKSTALSASLLRYGTNLLRQGLYNEAEPVCRESLERYAESDNGTWSHYHAMSVLGACLLCLERFDEAELVLLEAYQGLVDGIDQRPDYTPVRYDNLMETIATLYTDWGKPEKAEKWKHKVVQFDAAKQQAVKLRERAKLAADSGDLKNALKFYDQAEDLPWQREVHRRARIYARTLQWQKARETFQYAFVTKGNWQELGLYYRLGDLEAYRSMRKDVLHDYKHVRHSWNYRDDLQMALLEPLDRENEIAVRFLAAVNENHPDDPRSPNLIGKSKYRLGEFHTWYEQLHDDSPLRKGQQLLIAITNFQREPTPNHRQRLRAEIETHQEKSMATLLQNVWASHWADYFDQIAWIREAQRVLTGTEGVDREFEWPDAKVNLIEAGELLRDLPKLASRYIADGELDKAIQSYERLAEIPGMTPDRQLINLYARTCRWEQALNVATQTHNAEWRVPLLLAQLGRDSEARIATVDVLTNEHLREDKSHEYRHARLAGLIAVTDATRHYVDSLIDANSPPKTKEKWRCGMVGLMVYRKGEFREWYRKLQPKSPLRQNTELLVALTEFQASPTTKNRQSLVREVSKSDSKIQQLAESGDLGNAWPEHVCRVVITRDARQALDEQ